MPIFAQTFKKCAMIQDDLVKFYENSFKKNWDYPAFTDYNDKSSYTYSQVAEKIAELHLLFDAFQIKPDSKITLIGRNTPNWCVCALAVLTHGSTLVPILQDFKASDVQHIVNHSDSELFFCSDTIWETIEEGAIENVRGIFSLTDFGLLQQRDRKKVEAILNMLPELKAKKYPDGFNKDCVEYAPYDKNKVALINYTSGTTGFSKGVMLTANNLAGNVRFALDTELIKPRSNHLSFLPLAHAYGCAFDFLYTTSIGCHITLLGRTPSPKTLLQALDETKPEIVLMVPLIIEKLYRKNIVPALEKGAAKVLKTIPVVNGVVFSKVRKQLIKTFGGQLREVIIGGAALNQEVEDFLRKIKFPYTVGYGMTECGPIISYSANEKFVKNSAGMIIKNHMEVRIDSVDPYNIVGEIQVHGEHVMVGYYKNEQATEEVFTKDKWLKTGDMGTIDAEGNIFIRGRCKNMILGSSGQNIYPEELEAKLNNMPFVMESLVFEKAGKLIALVYPDFELLDSSGFTQKDLPTIMDENLKNFNETESNYQNIAQIRLYPNEFEKTPKKSIKRYLYSSIAE